MMIFILIVSPTLVGNMITSPQATLLGESVAIFCQTNGFPIPSISWQRNGVLITNTDNRITIFSFSPRRSADFASDTYNGNITEIILRNGLNVSSFDTRDALGAVGVFLIPNVTLEDSNTYSCLLYNRLPQTMKVSIQSKVVSLIVRSK